MDLAAAGLIPCNRQWAVPSFLSPLVQHSHAEPSPFFAPWLLGLSFTSGPLHLLFSSFLSIKSFHTEGEIWPLFILTLHNRTRSPFFSIFITTDDFSLSFSPPVSQTCNPNIICRRSVKRYGPKVESSLQSPQCYLRSWSRPMLCTWCMQEWLYMLHSGLGQAHVARDIQGLSRVHSACNGGAKPALLAGSSTRDLLSAWSGPTAWPCAKHPASVPALYHPSGLQGLVSLTPLLFEASSPGFWLRLVLFTMAIPVLLLKAVCDFWFCLIFSSNLGSGKRTDFCF